MLLITSNSCSRAWSIFRPVGPVDEDEATGRGAVVPFTEAGRPSCSRTHQLLGNGDAPPWQRLAALTEDTHAEPRAQSAGTRPQNRRSPPPPISGDDNPMPPRGAIYPASSPLRAGTSERSEIASIDAQARRKPHGDVEIRAPSSRVSLSRSSEDGGHALGGVGAGRQEAAVNPRRPWWR